MISLVLLFYSIEVITAKLSCYHCISQVPLDLVQQEERDAFKLFMFSKFNVPPSHPQCHDSNAYEFTTIRQQSCAAADRCVKTTVKELDFVFVMRGCLSYLYKPPFQISTNISCAPPSATCLCDTELCNSSPARLLPIILFLFTIT